MAELQTWLGGGLGGDVRPAGVLALLGHQDKNRFYYDDDDSAYSVGITARWEYPSLVILNGCKTGGVGATDFVEKLGANGVGAVVATAIGVDPGMAADFFVCLDEELAKRRAEEEDSGYEGPAVRDRSNLLGDILEETKLCLRDKKPWEFDKDTRWPSMARNLTARLALAYNLVGNPGIRICPPGEAE